ncbi:MAG: hypothetical protein LBP35_05630 [Candidatus Ancillula trichonymphae]|nr:hypothetical protein [Candidatus Ancillula trichonymphae]
MSKCGTKSCAPSKCTKLVRSTLMQLPHSYIKAGGRFEEMYYWDSYFTALGLKALGEHVHAQS